MVRVEQVKTAIRLVGEDAEMDDYLRSLIGWATTKLLAVTTEHPLAIPAREQACIALVAYLFDYVGGGESTKFANAFVNSGARAIVSEWLRPQTAMIDDAPPPAPESVETGPRVTDVTPPKLRDATINGAELQLVFGEALDPNFVPSAGRFAVHVNNGAARMITGILLGGSTVNITLARTVAGADNVTLDYRPDANGLRDLAGNLVAGFTGRTLANTSA